MNQRRSIFIAITFVVVVLIIIGFYINIDKNQPTISFSFDDGSIKDFPNNKNESWNKLLLEKLKNNDVKSVLFVKGKNLDNKRGMEILKEWDTENHLIANHTYSHTYFNSKKVTLEQYQHEFLKNDSLINNYKNYIKLFRYPYLKEGNTIEKRDGFRSFLKKHNYKVGHVTIDASDWYVNQRLVKRLLKNPSADITKFKEFYINHILDRATFYNQLGIDLTGENIPHNLLLHHNLTSALFIDDLIFAFKEKGWKIISAEKAFKHSIYNKLPKNLSAGESLLWALAKETKQYESVLRYPAEDSRYEKSSMDSLGL